MSPEEIARVRAEGFAEGFAEATRMCGRIRRYDAYSSAGDCEDELLDKTRRLRQALKTHIKGCELLTPGGADGHGHDNVCTCGLP